MTALLNNSTAGTLVSQREAMAELWPFDLLFLSPSPPLDGLGISSLRGFGVPAALQVVIFTRLHSERVLQCFLRVGFSRSAVIKLQFYSAVST